MVGQLTFTRAQLKFCDKGGRCNSVDWISQLPDEILVLILSFLTVKEAMLTSILSSRWQHLWESITRLDFDATKTLGKLKLQRDLLELERPKYVDWVNQVLRLYKGSTLDEFRIHFDLDNIYSHAIDEWIKFAITKRVQRLVLDFSFSRRVLFRHNSVSYTFPSRLLGPCSSNFPGMLPSTLVGFKCLKALYLKSVNMTAEDFQYFLSHCPVLEQLSVRGVKGLQSLRVSGFSLTLKFLEIVNCNELGIIEICDTNLVSFYFWGGNVRLLLVNVPHLVEVSCIAADTGFLKDIFDQLSSCHSQLRILTLTFPSPLVQIMELTSYRKLIKLKELIFHDVGYHDESLLFYISLIQAFPYLQRFVLKLERYETSSTNGSKATKPVTLSHQNLKVVELVGYNGSSSDFELAMCFIENAVALEKIIIDPRIPFLEPHISESETDRSKEQAARSRAHQQFEGKVSPEVFVIL